MSFLEGLTRAGVTRTAKTFLGENSTRLESLASKVVRGDAVTAAERADLKSIYTEYSRRALLDRAELLRAGGELAKTAKTPDEIRSDFFNKVLGHIGTKEADRVALRAAIIRNASEPTGDLVLAGGLRVSKAEADALRAQQRMGMVMNPQDTAKLKALDAAEQTADQAANAAAVTRASRVEMRDSARANTRDALRTQATEAEAAGKVIFKQDVELRHTTSRLESVYRTTGTMNVEEAFTTLRTQLTADPSKLLLVRNLDRANMPAPKDILKSIQEGRPITEREFTDLQTFFHNYDPSVRRTAPASMPSASPSIMPGTATGMAMNFGRDIINMATREGNSTAIPMRLRTLFETGSEPNFFRRTLAGIGETPIVRRALVGTALAGGLGIPAMHLTSNYLDPSAYGPVGTSAFTLLHQNWMSPSELKDVNGVTEVTSNLYFRTVTGGGFSNPKFIQYTKDFTGVDLLAPQKDAQGKDIVDANGKKTYVLHDDFKAGSDRTLRRLLEIANKLPSDVVPGYNTSAVEAYKYALAKFSGMPLSEYTGNKSIADHLIKKIGENEASRMSTNEEFRDKQLTQFYGRADLTQTDLIKRFAESTNKDPILRSVIGNYLVLQGALKPEELTVEGMKTLNQKVIQAEANTDKSTKDAVEQNAASRSNATADEIAARKNSGFSGSSAPASSGSAAPDPQKREQIKGMFNTLAADEDFPELKGQAEKMKQIYDNAKDATEFERELERQMPQVPPSVAKSLRDMAYGR